MYLYGYSTQQIADAFLALEKASYKGNTTKWTPGAIVQILRNERHCGDVFTRKTYTVSYRSHKKARNINSRPHSWYYDHHEAIVSRDDFIAVQHLLDNMKYGNRTIMPELRVIDSGILKGYVVINPRWAGFKEVDYYEACKVDLIITQKVSNIARKDNPQEVTFISSILASQEHPVGIYFVSENIFTLATYYMEDMHALEFFPEDHKQLCDGEPVRGYIE